MPPIPERCHPYQSNPKYIDPSLRVIRCADDFAPQDDSSAGVEKLLVIPARRQESAFPVFRTSRSRGRAALQGRIQR